MTRRILIEGVGGIGGLVAAGLIKEGYNVMLITNNEEITEAINNQGIIIQQDKHQEKIPATAHTYLKELENQNKFDLVFLIMKANSVLEAAKETKSFLKNTGYMATFQNGIVEDDVQSVIGKAQVVPVTVGFGGTMIKPGNYRKTSEGGFHIGELDGIRTKRIEELAEILRNVDRVVISDNMRGVLWSKLAINCTINTLGAITGQTLGEMLKNKQMRKLFLLTYSEVVDVAHALEIELEPITSNPYLLYIDKDTGWFKKLLKDLLVRYIGWQYRQVKSSTLQSIERGRKSEIDVLNGYVVKKAREVGVAVPVNQAITELMNMIDRDELELSSSNVELLLDKISSFDGSNLRF